MRGDPLANKGGDVTEVILITLLLSGFYCFALATVVYKAIEMISRLVLKTVFPVHDTEILLKCNLYRLKP